MRKIILSGWKSEFKKVEMNSLLRARFRFSLSKAKAAVDRILQGGAIEIAVADANLNLVLLELNCVGASFTLLEENAHD